MSGFLAQIISMASFGISNALWRKPIDSMRAEEAIVFRTIFSLLFFIVLLIFFEDFDSMNTSKAFGVNIWIFTVLVSCLSYFGLYFYNLGLKERATGLVATVSTISFLFGQLAAFVFLGEYFSNKYLIPFCLFLIMLVINDYKSLKKFKLSKGILYGLIAAAFWGLTLPLLAIPSNRLGFIKTGLVLEASVLLMSFLSLHFLYKQKLNWSSFKKYLPYFIMLGLLAGNGVLFNNLSYTKIPVHIAGALSSTTHIITILVAWMLFNEKLKTHQYVAALISGIAIYYISTIL